MTGTLRRPDGTLLPELVLAPHLTRRLHDHVLHFFERPAELPCGWTLDRTDPHDRASWVRTMAQRRLLRKSREAEALGPNALDILSARTLGAPTNADALETLATRLSPDELRRMLPLARERAALIAADLLSPSDVLETAIELSAAERLSTPWRYGGVRPAGTPDLRIVQWASLYSPGRMLGYGGRQHALERVAERDGSALIQAVSGQPTDYWHTHYKDRARLQTAQPGYRSIGMRAVDRQCRSAGGAGNGSRYRRRACLSRRTQARVRRLHATLSVSIHQTAHSDTHAGPARTPPTVLRTGTLSIVRGRKGGLGYVSTSRLASALRRPHSRYRSAPRRDRCIETEPPGIFGQPAFASAAVARTRRGYSCPESRSPRLIVRPGRGNPACGKIAASRALSMRVKTSRLPRERNHVCAPRTPSWIPPPSLEADLRRRRARHAFGDCLGVDAQGKTAHAIGDDGEGGK